MKRKIGFLDGIIMGYEKELVVGILPQIECSFRQRQDFFEFYFDETEVEFSLEQLDRLSTQFRVEIDSIYITIIE
jgi:hypothetical protein